jgi:hypothetical protein
MEGAFATFQVLRMQCAEQDLESVCLISGTYFSDSPSHV